MKISFMMTMLPGVAAEQAPCWIRSRVVLELPGQVSDVLFLFQW